MFTQTMGGHHEMRECEKNDWLAGALRFSMWHMGQSTWAGAVQTEPALCQQSNPALICNGMLVLGDVSPSD